MISPYNYRSGSFPYKILKELNTNFAADATIIYIMDNTLINNIFKNSLLKCRNNVQILHLSLGYTPAVSDCSERRGNQDFNLAKSKLPIN